LRLTHLRYHYCRGEGIAKAVSPFLVVCGAFLGLLATEAALAAPRVTAIRHWSAPDHTRIVLDLEAPAGYQVSTRSDPQRIVVDVAAGTFSCATAPLAVDDALVRRVRCNAVPEGAQVVIDLKGRFRHSAFNLDSVPGRKPPRIVIDVFPEARQASAAKSPAAGPAGPAKARADSAVAAKGPATAPVGSALAAESSAVAPAGPAPALEDPAAAPGGTAGAPTAAEAVPAAPAVASPFGRQVVVVIDPGHGGEDPGAMLRGQREQKITLDIARRMKRRLDAMPGYRAVLTREGDYTVGLARRREIAEEAGGDLLISIHCNTAPNRNAKGAEIFYLSTRGASSRRAQSLAELENCADQVGGIQPASTGAAELVLDARLKAVLRRSHQLATALHKQAKRHEGLRSRGIKRAGFAVCKTSTMPAALVEVGFLSNSADFELMRAPDGREKLAAWLAGSVDSFFRSHPDILDDPLFSSEPMLVYTVKRGDDLTHIARRHGVSVAEIVRVNKLARADAIRVGQRLILVGRGTESAASLTYEVRRGDSLSGIAARYGVTTSQLAAANGLRRPDRLIPGQKLMIHPGGAKGGKG
jgi:N-acetylmuramoyl-L-alanine amidase